MGRRPGEGDVAKLTQKGKGWTAEQRRKAAETRKLKNDGAEIARRLTSGDATYMRNLRKRLRAGSAGPIENLLWLLAHGKPREQITGEDVQARILEVREAAKKAIKAAKPRFALLPGPVVEAEVVETGGNGQS